MSCFQILITNCDKMRSAIANQWWGVEDDKRKIHWISWEWLSTPKTLGGMGFWDMVLFNQAMLGRQGWRLLMEPSSLCARVLKGRYFPHTDFWHAPKPRSSSYTWQSILFGWELLLHGVQWGVGNGMSIKITSDHWILDQPPYMLRPIMPIPKEATVNCLIDEQTRHWILETVNAFFDQHTTGQIIQIPICRGGGEDFVRWPHTKNGLYSVWSAYNFARSSKFFASRSAPGRGMASTIADEGKSLGNGYGRSMRRERWKYISGGLPKIAFLASAPSYPGQWCLRFLWKGRRCWTCSHAMPMCQGILAPSEASAGFTLARWYVQNVSTFPNTIAVVSPLICVFWIQLTRTNAVFSKIALVSCFCAEIQLSGKIPENTAKFLFYQKTHGARRRDGEGLGARLTTRGRDLGLAAPTYGEATSAIASTPPSAYLYPLTWKERGFDVFPR
jgi:hypothetical protein